MPRLHAFAATTLLLASVLACGRTDRALSIDQGLDSLSIDTFLGHMTALSSDAMAGRRPGTAGYDSAAAYLVRESRALGLEPGGVSGTYLQPIDFRRASVEPASAAFTVSGTALAYGSDYTLSPRTTYAGIDVQAPMVFAGFGKIGRAHV